VSWLGFTKTEKGVAGKRNKILANDRIRSQKRSFAVVEILARLQKYGTDLH
jgi:hypothetical protein